MEKKFVKPEELEAQVTQESLNIQQEEEANARSNDLISVPGEDDSNGLCGWHC